MARVLVDVMLRPEILDPQGQAILSVLPALGVSGVRGIRQGKHFEIELDSEVDEVALASVRSLAETLLSNPVIEEFSVHLAT